MKACIILPTYNEKENISKLLNLLLNEFKTIDGFDMHILVADDCSPDGTADIVRAFSKKYPNIHLSTGQKQGLGKAYIRAFKYVSENLKADVVFQMDADFSHDPKNIRYFLEQIRNGNDVVIGSRYIKGGGLDGIKIHRRLISKFGNFFARYVAGLYEVHDCTSGYRAIRASFLEKVDFDKVNTKGYAFLLTLLYELSSNKAKIKEIPIRFSDRKFGKTKLNKEDMYEFFLSSWKLNFRSKKIFFNNLLKRH